MKPVLTLLKHLYSVVTSAWVIINLTFWLVFLLLLAALKLLVSGSPAWLDRVNGLIERLYRAAAWIDSFWMLNVVGIRIEVDGELPDHPAPIIVVNHQTWFDIPILQEVVTNRGGPILKFLIKRHLVWVPVVGWICWALNFPRLYRGSHDSARDMDYQAIRAGANTLSNERGALLIFAEGTRFTDAKHASQQSPYRHLLNPRPGGLKIALGTVPPETPVVSVSIAYHGDTSFWHCLHGATRRISVRFRSTPAGEIKDSREWLAETWQEKDAWLSEQLSEKLSEQPAEPVR